MYAHNSSKRFQKKKWKYYFTKLDIYESLCIMCIYFVKFTYLIQLNFVVQILVFQGIGAWFSHFLIFNQELELVKKKK